MTSAVNLTRAGPGGIHIQAATALDTETVRQEFHAQLAALSLQQYIETTVGANADGHFIEFRLIAEELTSGTTDCDTTHLLHRLGLDSVANTDDLTREILLAMLLAPPAFQFRFPSHAEFASSVRIRKNIVEAARKTILSFDTMATERPEEYWRHVSGRGFTLRPGNSLITALKTATQPEESGALYAFSCYRATEYVILLGIAQELQTCNPELFGRLQCLWESRAIMSGEFHEVFLVEYGSLADPVPLKYFVPGDRTWFRNPDDHSSDITGYEGSWVMYLGGGLFTNFWKREKPYTLTSKCVEVFHWRNATYRDASGELQLDEAIVERLVESSMRNPEELERILAEMMRLREPPRVYVDGGCIDASREYARRVCPGTSDLVLPEE